MPTESRPSNKAKIARRVIEVLEFFDDNQKEATVMDIVRRYNRPQSSTSELLCSLVELGLLYKDPYTRSYSLTPRAALLGTAGQSPMLLDGSLPRLMDRLIAQTGLSVALFGKVGLNVQIISWRPGTRCDASALSGIGGGMQIPLTLSAAGLLLLSTIAEGKCDGILRRLNAEAPQELKFSCAEIKARIAASHTEQCIMGKTGFNAAAQMIGMLLPSTEPDHPLAVGVLFGGSDSPNLQSLQASMREAVQQSFGLDEEEAPSLKVLMSAA